MRKRYQVTQIRTTGKRDAVNESLEQTGLFPGLIWTISQISIVFASMLCEFEIQCGMSCSTVDVL